MHTSLPTTVSSEKESLTHQLEKNEKGQEQEKMKLKGDG